MLSKSILLSNLSNCHRKRNWHLVIYLFFCCFMRINAVCVCLYIRYTNLWWYIQCDKFSYNSIANQAASISIRLCRAYVRSGKIMFEKLLNLWEICGLKRRERGKKKAKKKKRFKSINVKYCFLRDEHCLTYL